MSKKCQLTGKRFLSGHKVSHSNIKTKKRFNINLQTKKIINPATGKPIKIKISTSGLKTLNKWLKQGKIFDIRDFIKKNK